MSGFVSKNPVAAESTYEMAGCHLKVFYGKPDIYIYIYVCVCVHLTNNNFLIISN